MLGVREAGNGGARKAPLFGVGLQGCCCRSWEVSWLEADKVSLLHFLRNCGNPTFPPHIAVMTSGCETSSFEIAPARPIVQPKIRGDCENAPSQGE